MSLEESTITNVVGYVNQQKNQSNHSSPVSFQQNTLLQDQDKVYSNVAVNFPPMMTKPSTFMTTLDSPKDTSRPEFVPFMKKRF